MGQNFIKKLITGFSMAFARTYRVTLILFVATLILGFLSYSQFLKREGNPAVEVPIVVLQIPYLVDNAAKVDTDVTKPIEQAIKDLTEVKKIQSTTDKNVSAIIVTLEQNVTSEDGAEKIKERVEGETNLPESAEVNYATIQAGAVDGTHDILIALSNKDKSTQELQAKAAKIAQEFEKLPEVKESNAIDLITKEINPFTGQLVDFQKGFNRVGKKDNGDLKFENAVNIGIVKSKEAGLIDASDAMHEAVQQLEDEGELKGYEISFGGDFAIYNKNQVSQLETNALQALVAVIVILFLFLNWRASIVGAIFIPTVMAATFAALYLIGYSLNFMVLYSVVLVLGLFVDDAIVVVEAVDYHKQQGKRGLEAVRAAINDIGVADVLGTITTVLVFAPMAFISGILGDFIRFIPVTVIIALVLSIIIALTLITFLSSFLVPNYRKKEEKTENLTRFGGVVCYGVCELIRKLSNKVGDFVRSYLSKTWSAVVVFAISLGLIVMGLFFAGKLKFSTFAPPKDSTEIMIIETFPSGTTMAEVEGTALEIEEIVIDKVGEFTKEVNYMDANQAQAFLFLTIVDMGERDKTTQEMVDELESEFEKFKKADILVNNAIVGPPDSGYQFFAQVFSEDQATLEKASNHLVKFLKDKKIMDGEKVEEVAVGYLGTITKFDGKRAVQVKAALSDPENSGLIIELQNQVEEEYNKDRLKELNLDEEGIGFDQGFEGELMGSFNSAFFALFVAIIIMYILLVVQYNSFSLPLLILLAIPFTFAGLFPGLYFTGNALSFFVMVGIIALSGIVVNNTIMLIDFANRNRLAGQGIRESIAEALKVRFRPIVTTSITTIVALIPLALSDPFWESMVYTIIFGLVASTILVVTAFPVWYAIIQRIRDWKKALGTRIREKLAS